MLTSHFLFFQDQAILKVYPLFQFTAFLILSYVTIEFYMKMTLIQQFLTSPIDAYFFQNRSQFVYSLPQDLILLIQVQL